MSNCPLVELQEQREAWRLVAVMCSSLEILSVAEGVSHGLSFPVGPAPPGSSSEKHKGKFSDSEALPRPSLLLPISDSTHSSFSCFFGAVSMQDTSMLFPPPFPAQRPQCSMTPEHLRNEWMMLEVTRGGFKLQHLVLLCLLVLSGLYAQWGWGGKRPARSAHCVAVSKECGHFAKYRVHQFF